MNKNIQKTTIYDLYNMIDENKVYDDHYFICDSFVESGFAHYPQEYTCLYESLIKFDDFEKLKDVNKNDLQYQALILKHRNDLNFIKSFGNIIKLNNNISFPSQKWHLMISYCEIIKCIGKWDEYKLKPVYRFKCPELTLYCAEILNDINKLNLLNKKDGRKNIKLTNDEKTKLFKTYEKHKNRKYDIDWNNMQFIEKS